MSKQTDSEYLLPLSSVRLGSDNDLSLPTVYPVLALTDQTVSSSPSLHHENLPQAETTLFLRRTSSFMLPDHCMLMDACARLTALDPDPRNIQYPLQNGPRVGIDFAFGSPVSVSAVLLSTGGVKSTMHWWQYSSKGRLWVGVSIVNA